MPKTQNCNINIRISKELVKRLERQKKITGAPVAEIVRRAVNSYLDTAEKIGRQEEKR